MNQSLEESDWKNPTMRRPFESKLAEVVRSLQAADVAESEDEYLWLLTEAIQKLQHDILPKTDGFYGGRMPDDWIVTEVGQAEIFWWLDMLTEALLEEVL